MLFTLAPIACAQSSIIEILFFLAIDVISLILHDFPAKCTGMMALVLDVIDFLIDGIKIFRFSSTSANTGVAPVNNTELAVATNVMSGIITSDPFPIPSAFSDRCNAAVPLDTPIANFAPVNLAKIDSNLRSFGPSVSSLEFNAFNTAFLSFFVISGIINGTFIEASPMRLFSFSFKSTLNSFF